MEYQYSKIRLNSPRLSMTPRISMHKENPRNTQRVMNNASLSQFSQRVKANIIGLVLKKRTLVDPNPILRNQAQETGSKRSSRIKLCQYLSVITRIGSKHSKLKFIPKDTKQPFPTSDTNASREKENRVVDRVPAGKRKIKTLLPYSQIDLIVSKVYKHYDALLKLRYSTDQIISIIRQICSKRKNIQFLFLNRKQKPKRLYYTYDLKTQNECSEAIIKQSIQNRNGKFQSIFRDIINFCSFFEDELIEKSGHKIKEIKKSIIHLKQQLQCNEYSEELGFNNFVNGKNSCEQRTFRSKFMSENADAMQYISVINRNMDQELVNIENEVGDFLQQNRNAVDVLAKIKKNINR